MSTLSTIFLCVVGVLSIVKLCDAIALVVRLTRFRAQDSVREIEAPVWEWAAGLGKFGKHVMNGVFRAPMIVLLTALAVFLGAGACSPLLVGVAMLGVVTATNVIVVLLVAIVIERARGGDVYWVGGLHRIRVRVPGENRSKPIDPLLAAPTISVFVVLSYAALYRSLYVVDGDAFLLPHAGMGLLDALYFSLITSTTVGYGDFQPISDGAQLAVVAQLLTTVSGVALVAGYLLSGRERNGRPTDGADFVPYSPGRMRRPDHAEDA